MNHDRSDDGTSRFVLFLGNIDPNSAVSRLKASGVRYLRKRLDSGPENWATICAHLNDPGLICVIGQLNTKVFNRFVSPGHAEVARVLLDALSRVPHMLFAHESVITGEPVNAADGEPADADDDESWVDYLRSSGYFESPAEDVRSAVTGLFEEFQVRLVPYSTNAEFEVMANAFVEDNERDLLFRIYVPAGRLYAAEADKLLSLFREWLSKVGNQRVRQDGYETAAGHMYEFYGDGEPRSQDLAADFRDFSDFLDLCVDDPGGAEDLLIAHGFDRRTSAGLVARYGKEARRLALDLKHERELRVVAIRHQLEAEVLETSIESGGVASDAADRLVNALVPLPTSGFAGVLSAARKLPTAPAAIQVQLNQQIIEKVEGTVVQSVQGTTNIGPEAKELLELVARYGGPDTVTLTTAVHELEDVDAGAARRVRAKQLLKGFLINVGRITEEVVTSSLTKYVENKLGI